MKQIQEIRALGDEMLAIDVKKKYGIWSSRFSKICSMKSSKMRQEVEEVGIRQVENWAANGAGPKIGHTSGSPLSWCGM